MAAELEKLNVTKDVLPATGVFRPGGYVTVTASGVAEVTIASRCSDMIRTTAVILLHSGHP